MRSLVCVFYFIISPFYLPAQPSPVETLTWYGDIAEAKKVADVKHKDILICFSGSDWCKPCIQLREKILNTSTFISFANESLIMVQADFPRLKKNKLSKEQTMQNEQLAEQYNKQGIFPFIVIIDASGHVRGTTTSRDETPLQFVGRIKGILTKP